MSEERQHRGIFHHKKDEEERPADTPYADSAYSSETAYSETAYSSGGPGGYAAETTYSSGGPGGYATETTEAVAVSAEGDIDYRKEEKHHKRLEEVGGFGATAAGAYALVIIYIYTPSFFFFTTGLSG